MNQELKPDAINQVLREINHQTGDLFDFVMVVSGMTGAIRMEANGKELTMMEIRIIMMIRENTGNTATKM